MTWLILSEMRIHQKRTKWGTEITQFTFDPTGHQVETSAGWRGGGRGDRLGSPCSPPVKILVKLDQEEQWRQGRRSPTLEEEPAGFPDGFNTKRESKTGIEDEAKEEWDCQQRNKRKLKQSEKEEILSSLRDTLTCLLNTPVRCAVGNWRVYKVRFQERIWAGNLFGEYFLVKAMILYRALGRE